MVSHTLQIVGFLLIPCYLLILLYVSSSPTRPWSMVWLLAMFRCVMPCFRNTGSTVVSARNTNRLLSGDSFWVTGHSMLATTTWAVANRESTDCEKRRSASLHRPRRHRHRIRFRDLQHAPRPGRSHGCGFAAPFCNRDTRPSMRPQAAKHP